jgi:hypothetical protein
VPYAATRIWDVAEPARNDMDVGVIDRLPCGPAAVDPNVHAVDALLLRELLADLLYEGEQRRPFVSPEILNASEMPARDHQQMAF